MKTSGQQLKQALAKLDQLWAEHHKVTDELADAKVLMARSTDCVSEGYAHKIRQKKYLKLSSAICRATVDAFMTPDPSKARLKKLESELCI